jgi:polar amino acid transport system permease protein
LAGFRLIAIILKKFALLNRSTKDLVKILIFAICVLWLLVAATAGLNYNWQWYRIPKYLFIFDETGLKAGALVKGLLVTLEISLISLFFAFVTGLLTALARLSDSLAARTISRIYLEIVRNTPLLIQLFFIYFVAAPVFDISAFVSAVAALSLFEGAYTSEIIRAGILRFIR